MRRIWIALRVFFSTLFHADVAAEVQRVLGRSGPAAQPEPRQEPTKPRPAVQSEAVTLLATLQREARFVDFIKEPLGEYSDAQIGAAARDFHRDCGAVLERMFAIRPINQDPEGSETEVPAGFDAARYRLTGGVSGQPPFCGHLRHHGWEATRCELPVFSGSSAAGRTVAPVEVEVLQGEKPE
jgi:hypothetical protein